jgi:hypothetical protein
MLKKGLNLNVCRLSDKIARVMMGMFTETVSGKLGQRLFISAIENWSEQVAHAALGRCRQSEVATINSVFSLSFSFSRGSFSVINSPSAIN